MLHIGNKSINLAVKNAGVLYVGSRKMGPIINEESSSDSFVTQSGDTIVTSTGTPLVLDGISSLTTAPSITDTQLTFADDGNNTVSFSIQQLKEYVNDGILHQYDRIDNKATVAGFWTDGNGQKYAVCVVDAQYRSGSVMSWNGVGTNTILPDYSSSSALSTNESGTYNTNVILTTYSTSDYPAFTFARNACTVTMNNQTFKSCLPNLKELQMLYNDRATLDTYDPTLSSYSSRSLTEFKFGGTGSWSSTEFGENHAYHFYYDGRYFGTLKSLTEIGVCPIIEIPVNKNGTVITN